MLCSVECLMCEIDVLEVWTAEVLKRSFPNQELLSLFYNNKSFKFNLMHYFVNKFHLFNYFNIEETVKHT